jgi:hypothetical protein
VFAHARDHAVQKTGVFSARVFADMLLWPRNLRNSSPSWQAYCQGWEDIQGLPALPKADRLNGVAAAGVLYVIVSAMRAVTKSPDCRQFDAYLRATAIAERAHVSSRTVHRVFAWQKDAPFPLVQILKPGSTRGVRHGCYRFQLVTDPIAFARQRDAARLEIAADRKRRK